MASSEVTFRTEILEASRKLSYGWASALPSIFQAGLPDVVLQCKGWPTLFLELKFLERSPSDSYALNLTPGQRLSMRRIIEAGGHAAWALCVKVRIKPGPRWVLLASRDWITQTASLERHLVQTRLIGEEWDMERLLNRCARSAESQAARG